MNNSKYPDMLFNCLPKPENKIIKSFAITFANEAKLGDNLKIYVAYTDGKYYMRSVLEDGRTNVEAEFETENIDWFDKILSLTKLYIYVIISV